jgi:hypothetical protein
MPARIVIRLDYDPTNPDQRIAEDRWLELYDWLIAELNDRFQLRVRSIEFDGIR